MNILKKQIAPLSDKAWKEIIDQSKEIFNIYLTARKFIDIDGPNGLEQGGVSTGRLIKTSNQIKEGVNYGLREVIPLVEIRKPFELDIWEMDNVDRGASDVDLEPAVVAAKQVALFEENLIYKGLKDGQVLGLEKSSIHPKATLPNDPKKLLKVIGEQVTTFKKHGVEGPFTLVLSDKKWEELASLENGYPFVKHLEEVLNVKVIINHGNFNSFIISERGGDFVLSIGQDISIGYDSHDTKKVKLYFAESFTFRVISPEAVIVLENSK
ncbi:MAG TPA: bacteriocin [Bacteroidales bacterium]|nr:bacteriocin [Bacteroidales bacterium]